MLTALGMDASRPRSAEVTARRQDRCSGGARHVIVRKTVRQAAHLVPRRFERDAIDQAPTGQLLMVTRVQWRLRTLLMVSAAMQ